MPVLKDLRMSKGPSPASHPCCNGHMSLCVELLVVDGRLLETRPLTRLLRSLADLRFPLETKVRLTQAMFRVVSPVTEERPEVLQLLRLLCTLNLGMD